MKRYLNTTSYNAKIELPYFDGILFNHGTESRVGTRTGGHKLSCKKESFEYDVISETADDRLFGKKVISPESDTEYVKRIADYINEKMNSNLCKLYPEWLNSLTVGSLNAAQKGIINGLDATDLSKTECIYIPNPANQYLPEAIKEVNKWYYTDKSIRINAKESKASSENSMVRLANGEKNVCRPIVWQFHETIRKKLNIILNNNKLRLSIKKASIQSLSLAYYLSSILPNAKIRVVIVANDKEQNKELYNIMSVDSKFELIECESDADVEDIYMNDTKDFDLIIGNPPYENTLHGKILDEVLRNNPKSIVEWLAPHNLTWSNDRGLFDKVRLNTESKLTNYVYIGYNFGDITLGVDIGIYSYCYAENNSFTYNEAFAKKPIDPLANSILTKYVSMNKISFGNRIYSPLIDGKAITADSKHSIEQKEIAAANIQSKMPKYSLAFIPQNGVKSLSNRDKFCIKESKISNLGAGRALILCSSEEEQSDIFDNIYSNELYRAMIRFISKVKSTGNDILLSNPWPYPNELNILTNEEKSYLIEKFGK